MPMQSRQRGVSLIEVLMAVLIFSVGLIGLASLMVMSTRSSHAAYLRTQATFLASNMADRMRANPVGVWNGNYNSDAYPIKTGSVTCDKSTACNPQAVATRDKVLWSRLMSTQLPDATATIQCKGTNGAGYDPSAQIGLRPPYGGTCSMTISWTERKVGDGDNSDAAPQVFAWGFQP
jgi:type IV pilus assembly protein PilV